MAYNTDARKGGWRRLIWKNKLTWSNKQKGRAKYMVKHSEQNCIEEHSEQIRYKNI